MWDHVLGLTCCLQYTAVCTHSAGRHVAQASSPVLAPQVLTDLDTDGYLLQEVP